LARGLHRLAGESRIAFKQKVRRLHEYFERFNVDVSEICQWIMGLRPGGKVSKDESRPFWEFFLMPGGFLAECSESQLDGHRLQAFEVAVGWQTTKTISGFPQQLIESVQWVVDTPCTPTAQRMLARLRQLSRPHRIILLKAAAEWITARYVRGYENWVRQNEEWLREKTDWEKTHPGLTGAVRQLYNEAFKKLEITSKKPRVCFWSRLRQSADNCAYAGERIKCGSKWQNHSPLCKEFKDFKCKRRKYFISNAQEYLAYRRTQKHSSAQAMDCLLKKVPQAKWFRQSWQDYLQTLNIKEETILRDYGGRLPHCLEFKGEEDCKYNPHTDKCKEYRKLLDQMSESDRQLEELYRQWRSEYLAAPRKPSFRYPSSRTLPVPKIFGKDFFEVDFDNSVLRLRLDDMAEGDFLPVGFKPWPKDYDFQPADVQVTSVHVHFVGTRARVGFRFKVPHKVCRLKITQDEIDELRSRTYPRQTQDQEFLDEVRRRLLERFAGQPEQELRILTVDLGQTGAAAALFVGEKIEKSVPLNIIKMEKLYTTRPDRAAEARRSHSKEDESVEHGSGLSKEHVGKHLDSWADGTQKIAQIRAPAITDAVRTHDMRRLSQHIRWMIRDWVRLNTSQIIKIAEQENADLIVFESLRGFRAPGYDKIDPDKKRRLAYFAFGQVRTKTKEKAVERGMRVVTVPYLCSSQYCSKCWREQSNKSEWRKNKTKEKKFICENRDCRSEMNSDENAVCVLGRVFWGHIVLPSTLERKST
jgi:IS605 OrfB family transposase